MKTYRQKPEDICYKKGSEAPTCLWCRWHNRVSAYSPNIDWCSNPNLNPFGRAELTLNKVAKNLNGTPCPNYQPSGFTRFARLFGIRKPQSK